MEAGDAPAAVHIFESLLEKRDYAQRRDIQRMLASCYANVDRLMEARSILLDVVADDRGAEDAGVWQELGAIAYDVNDFRTVGRAGRRLMALAPQAPEGYVFRALWFQREGRSDQALEALDQGASRGALGADGLVMRGVIAAQLGHDEHARKSFALAIEKDPAHELARLLSDSPTGDSQPLTSFSESE
jgi:tetratricopeptide (TPR) repeat protein